MKRNALTICNFTLDLIISLLMTIAFFKNIHNVIGSLTFPLYYISEILPMTLKSLISIVFVLFFVLSNNRLQVQEEVMKVGQHY